ncbi:MAG: BLUF domain-containing protein [Pseudomonadota bacterium]
MIGLLYKSTASRAMTPLAIDHMLKKARIRNRQRHLTGVLVFSDQFFMQYLEGPEETVRDVFQAIQADQRHNNVKELLVEEVAGREFGEWSMAYLPMYTKGQAAAQDIVASQLTAHDGPVSRARAMLLEFVQPANGRPTSH